MACDPYSILSPFNFRVIDKLPDSSGVYGFWLVRRCIYIGKAEKQSIRNRLFQHLTDCHNADLSAFIDAYGNELRIACKCIDRLDQIDVMERYCIRRFQPITNVQRYLNHVEVPPGCFPLNY